MSGLEYILTIGACCLLLMSGCVVTTFVWSLLYHINLDNKNSVRAMMVCFSSGVLFMGVAILIFRV